MRRRILSLVMLVAVTSATSAVLIQPTAHAAPYAAITEPNADVLDGQTVTVHWSGYEPGWGNDVRQCKSQVFDLEADCTPSFGGVTNADGAGSVQLKIRREVQNAAGTGIFLCDADNPCGVLVQRDTRDPATRAFAPVFFAGSSRPLATCADATPDTLVSGTGASAAIEAFRRWIQQLCQPLAGGVALDYNFRSSPEGRRAVIDKQGDFGVSSRAFTAEELEELKAQGRDDEFVYVPVAASALGLVYNAWYKDPNPPGEFGREVYRQIRDLCVSAETAAKLVTGQVSYLYDGNGYPDVFADTTIVAENPQLAPLAQSNLRPLAVPIKPIARADASFSTWLLTSWFQAEPNARSAWRRAGDEFRQADVTEIFPAARGIDGRVLVQNTMKLVTTFPGELERLTSFVPRSAWFTWADVSVARSYGLPVAKVKDLETGQCVEATPESIGLGLAAMTKNPDGVTRTANFSPNVDARAYPMPTITYVIAPTTGLDPDKATALKQALEFIIGPGQERLTELGYVALPADVLETAKVQVAKLSGETSAVETPPQSFTDTGLLDSAFPQSQFPLDSTFLPAASTDGSAADNTDGQDLAETDFDLIRFITSGSALPVLLVLMLGFAALVGGPMLQMRARRAASRGS